MHPKLSLGAFDCLKVYQGNCFLHHNAPCENLPTKTSPLLSLNLLVMALMVQNFSQKAEDQVLGVQQDGAKQLGSHHRASNTFTLFLDAKDISQHHSAQGVNEPLETGMSFGTGRALCLCNTLHTSSCSLKGLPPFLEPVLSCYRAWKQRADP